MQSQSQSNTNRLGNLSDLEVCLVQSDQKLWDIQDVKVDLTSPLRPRVNCPLIANPWQVWRVEEKFPGNWKRRKYSISLRRKEDRFKSDV